MSPVKGGCIVDQSFIQDFYCNVVAQVRDFVAADNGLRNSKPCSQICVCQDGSATYRCSAIDVGVPFHVAKPGDQGGCFYSGPDTYVCGPLNARARMQPGIVIYPNSWPNLFSRRPN